MITQAEFDDVVRQTKLSKEGAEIWGSRKRNKTTEVDKVFSFSDESKNISYCNDIDGLFDYFEHQHDPAAWRLFLDGNTTNLKGVLLHIGNEYPSIPIVYATDVKETYAVMNDIMEFIKYDKFAWRIFCDLKVVFS